MPVTARGSTYQVYYETAGSGRDLLCLHTAGADGRQFHRLMADPRLTAEHRLVAFDLPWHGKSPPPPGAVPGSWRLDTDLYVELIMGFIAAARLDRPIVLGASMSGEICLELAYRHPEAFAGIIACEASERIERRQTPYAAHPQVNQAYFVPEWIRGLIAPQSPAECAEEIVWHYAQGGPAVFYGDIAFYAGDWDARERVGRIDTNRCPAVHADREIRLLLHGRGIRPRPRRKSPACDSSRCPASGISRSPRTRHCSPNTCFPSSASSPRTESSRLKSQSEIPTLGFPD